MNKAPSEKPAVKELPNATYFVKSAEPLDKGASEITSSFMSSLQATKNKEEINKYFKFLYMIEIIKG